MRGLSVLAILGVALVAWPTEARECRPDEEFCYDDAGPDAYGGISVGDPCWDPEFGDVCNDPPAPCVDEERPPLKLTWDEEGNNEAGGEDQISVIDNNPDRYEACIYIHGVTQTGYYRLYDEDLAESCTDQRDETAYVTVQNECNGEGWAVEANVGNRYIVLDMDNTPKCTPGSCVSGWTCREGNMSSNCCVPQQKAFLGTFLLVAGKANKLCLHHWCPEWLEAKEKDEDLGFVTNNCDSANSVHLLLGNGFAGCEDDNMLKPCSWGCEQGQCLPDPCEAKNCPAFCKDGECVDANPCASMTCKHGCKNGRCLQPPSAPGPDGDGDGYPFVADCDDTNAEVHPRHAEVCSDGVDNDCDGLIDEADVCGSSSGDGGTVGDGGGSGSDESGCGCMLQPRPRSGALLLLLAFGLWMGRRASKRRRRTAG